MFAVLAMVPRAAGWCLFGLLVLAWPAAAASTAADTELKIPLTIPYALLGDLAWQPAEGEGPAEFVDGACRRLRIESSWLDPRDNELYLVSRGEARLGISLFGFCIRPINWSGSVEALLEPYIDEEWQLRFRLGRTELRDTQGKPVTLLNLIGRLIRPFISRRTELFGFDLGAPKEQITELLSNVVDPEHLAELQSVLTSLHLGRPQVDGRGVIVEAQLTLPDGFSTRLSPPGQADEAGLARSSLTQLQLERLDAFMVAVVKLLGKEITDPALRQQLLALLLESRYRLVDILGDDEPFDEEPVRSLFISDWERLRSVLLAVDPGTIAPSRLLRYATFLNAGDTLLALDAALPQRTPPCHSSRCGFRATGYALRLTNSRPSGRRPAWSTDMPWTRRCVSCSDCRPSHRRCRPKKSSKSRTKSSAKSRTKSSANHPPVSCPPNRMAKRIRRTLPPDRRYACRSGHGCWVSWSPLPRQQRPFPTVSRNCSTPSDVGCPGGTN